MITTLSHKLDLDFSGYYGRDNRLGEHSGFPNHSFRERKMYEFDLQEQFIYLYSVNSFELATGSYADKWMNLAGRKNNTNNKTNIAIDYLRSHYGWVIHVSDNILGF